MATLRVAQSVVVLTGAGISAESGIPTFRDASTGLWAKFDPKELATPEAFQKHPEMVARWYDERRQQCAACEPNPGHYAIAGLQEWMTQRQRQFTLVTQTVDRLHQAAGSRDVLELHGTLWVWRCVRCGTEREERGGPFATYPPRCQCAGLRRPAVVWFGEALPEDILKRAHAATRDCDFFFSVGTSSQVYPAAGLADEAARAGARVVEINPASTSLTARATWTLAGKAGEVLPALVRMVCGKPFKE